MENIWNEEFIKNPTLAMEGLWGLGVFNGNNKYGIHFTVNQIDTALTFKYSFTIKRKYLIDIFYYSKYFKNGQPLQGLIMDVMDLSFAPATISIDQWDLYWSSDTDNINVNAFTESYNVHMYVSISVVCLPHFDLNSFAQRVERVRSCILKSLMYLKSRIRIELYTNKEFKDFFESKKSLFEKDVKIIRSNIKKAKDTIHFDVPTSTKIKC